MRSATVGKTQLFQRQASPKADNKDSVGRGDIVRRSLLGAAAGRDSQKEENLATATAVMEEGASEGSVDQIEPES